jgi:glyoxylase-like metal-dependent hydrolase (beta-lactamase superfamily II)
VPENTLTRISPHVYWLPPGPPDRPALCAVAGSEQTLLLDAGSSPAHVRRMLDGLAQASIRPPRYLALTHWHWDHVFGAAEPGTPVIAHALTAERLAVMAGYDWGDAAIAGRVKTGEEVAVCARDIQIELPEPRHVTIAAPDLVFQTALDVRLGGGVTCHIQYVGGDHSADSSVMMVGPDRVLFLGDCLYSASAYLPAPYYTRRNLYPLLDVLLGFDPQVVIWGHEPQLMGRAEFDVLAGHMRLIGGLVEQLGADEPGVQAALRAEIGVDLDENLRELIESFILGRDFETT